MADSAAETGLSNAASGSDHAGVATDVDAVGPNDAASSVREGEPKTVDVPMRRKRKVPRGVAVPNCWRPREHRMTRRKKRGSGFSSLTLDGTRLPIKYCENKSHVRYIGR
jgi:hypothetical protein